MSAVTRAAGDPTVTAREPRLRALAAFYLATMRAAIQTQLQYRVANYFYMLGMVAEPVIYLVVWSSIADSSGGTVDGLTAGQLAAYYIVWTLVRNMNIVFGAPFWEFRIREGQLSGQLLRPLHPLHYDVAYFAGWKIVVIGLWIPIAIVLSALFHPDLHPTALEIAVFCVAIWGAYLVRTMFQSTIGMLNFWTTRGGAMFDLYMTLELLLSGRLVPLQLMPGWVQTLATFLPFKWTFYFPIESLVGDMSTRSLLLGLAAQALWVGIGLLLFRLAWRSAIKRFSAVGG
ncbi:MAG TPA: ABC-2 family transporter protein [Gaiellaceae bacterium]|nr:ABC-2 family transporter protein [Gaiellaceae bacterium]